MRSFNINLIIASTQAFKSYPETLSSGSPLCPNASNPNLACTCIGSCVNSTSAALQSLHHKNAYNIHHRVPHPAMTQHLTLLLSGHKVCQQNGAACDPEGPLGLASMYKGVATVFINSSSTNSNGLTAEKIQKTVAHEIGHLFAAPDHYGTNGIVSTAQKIKETGNPGFNVACIYGEDKDKSYVYSNITICDGCKAEIEAHASLYNH